MQCLWNATYSDFFSKLNFFLKLQHTKIWEEIHHPLCMSEDTTLSRLKVYQHVQANVMETKFSPW